MCPESCLANSQPVSPQSRILVIGQTSVYSNVHVHQIQFKLIDACSNIDDHGNSCALECRVHHLWQKRISQSPPVADRVFCAVTMPVGM